jgi:penicillin-binding protein 1A
MMQGITKPGGTAPGANAAGHPLAGKTGTVNDHTDVWFIGYTPTYVTGVWMGNPEKKTNLGRNMTGGHGALPYFNAFMSEFMKDKEKEEFYETPEMPSDIKALVNQREREEQEKLEKADEEARKLGVSFNTGTKTRSRTTNETTTTTDDETSVDSTLPATDSPDAANPDGNPPPKITPREETPKPATAPPPIKKPEPPPAEKPKEGTKRKGKKGGGDSEPPA